MTEYNGWTNYETWVVALWIDNEEGTYHHVRELAREAIEEGNEGNPCQAAIPEDSHIRHRIEDAYKDYVEELVSEQHESGTLASDLVSAALCEVNWREIAENLMEELGAEETIRERQEA